MALDTPTEREIRALAARAERIMTDAAVDTIIELQRAVENYSFRLRAILAEAFRDASTLPSLAEAIELADTLADALIEAGLGDVMEAYIDGFRRVQDDALDYFQSFGIRATRAGIDVDGLNALVSLQEQAFLNLADRRLVSPMRDAVIQGVIGGRPRNAVLDEITRFMEDAGIVTRADKPFTDFQIETLVNDSYRRYYRQVKAEKAEALEMEVIWYQGPDDKITRPACHAMLNNGKHGVPDMHLRSELTIEQVNQWVGKPVQKENPLVVGGGWRCRHTLHPVTLAFAVSKGFKPPPGVTTDEDIEANAEGL